MEYDGTDFVGWQTQENGRSVQGEITKALKQILQESVNVIGAGRTDTGVHAKGQVANFRTHTSLETKSIVNAINGVLANDIRVLSAADVPGSFHARYDARERVYRYHISLKPVAIERQYQWFVKYDLDLASMNVAAGQIVGEHNFESFCKSESGVKHYRCMVSKSGWVEMQTKLVYEIRANRFLHGMVRALVGTMVDIGRGYTSRSAFQEILGAKDRSRAGMAAPPQGLFLHEVVY
jgi:tRNA pseudouridine38-40 synthase